MKSKIEKRTELVNLKRIFGTRQWIRSYEHLGLPATLAHRRRMPCRRSAVQKESPATRRWVMWLRCQSRRWVPPSGQHVAQRELLAMSISMRMHCLSTPAERNDCRIVCDACAMSPRFMPLAASRCHAWRSLLVLAYLLCSLSASGNFRTLRTQIKICVAKALNYTILAGSPLGQWLVPFRHIRWHY